MEFTTREDWGAKPMEPRDFVDKDYEWIKESGLIIAYLDGTSSGLYIEIGWASLLQKNILVLHKEETKFSPMILGLDTEWMDTLKCHVKIVSFEDDKELVEKLERVLKNSSEAT